MYTESIEY
ncbi:Protein of unknown function [Bacillus mycoides]|uniref:Uncharacterized protein n=1 Tax=Bacillus mycoides TaxID=1405 RepID=A0A1G4ESD8_BACMY|nr:Protein of unknown function [Bacillus mycoides]